MRGPLRYELLDRALARGLLPDAVLRVGSRAGARARIGAGRAGGVEAASERFEHMVETLSSGPVAEVPERANEQHYELPPEFFGLFLGPRRKYSGCLWRAGVDEIAAAEEAMLELTCERAGIEDGMAVLDLGCGWGALSLWIAERYPNASVLSVSNSAPQREWISARAAELGIENLQLLTADVNALELERRFDRVVSVEMFEHMRNWRELLRRIAGWLEPGGKVFIHVFSHREHPYRFVDTWASERFFSGGTMPSHDLLPRFADDLVVSRSWAVSGSHYERTLRAWLERLDARSDEALEILGRVHGAAGARAALGGWRLFLISTAEIWGYRSGDEWLVSHYLLAPRGASGRKPLVRST